MNPIQLTEEELNAMNKGDFSEITDKILLDLAHMVKADMVQYPEDKEAAAFGMALGLEMNKRDLSIKVKH